MAALLLILIGTVLVNTFLLAHSMNQSGSGRGITDRDISDRGVSDRNISDRHVGVVATAIRIAAATLVTFLLASVLTAILTLLVLQQLLINHLRDALLLMYAVIVVGTAVLLHRAARDRMPKLRRSLASSPVLIVSNCLALGSSLLAGEILNWTGNRVALGLVGGSLAIGIGFGILLAMFVALNERITQHAVPLIFRRAPLTMISAGILALALLGFTGLWRG